MSQHRGRYLLPLVTLVALAGALLPGAAAAAPATPGLDSGPSSVMRLASARAATAVPRDARPFTQGAALATPREQAGRTATAQTSSTPARPQVFGYANAGNLGDSGSGSGTWRYQDLTTVAFFGLHVNSDGTLASDGGMTVWNSQDLTNLINRAHPAGVKVVLSIIQQDQGTLCSSLANAQTTVTQVINQINAKAVDGVNIDYEGTQATCGASGDTMASRLDNLAKLFRQQLPANRSNLTIATYASSAYFSNGFFDVAGLKQYVNQFFVMAYDLDNSNWSAAPLNCSSYCFSPVGPLSGYSWTDQRTVSTYTAVVPASQVILGVPYYGWYACVASPASNAYPVNCPGTSSPAWVNPTYLTSLGVPTTSGVSQYSSHTDAHDSSEHWASWYSSDYKAWREMYIDDPSSLGAKYDLVTSSGIAGAGIFALDYGGGDSGIWGSIESHLTCPVSVGVPSSVTSTRFQITLSEAPGCAKSIDVQAYDVTINGGWYDLATPISPATSSLNVDTYAGHTYGFRARALDVYGRTDDWTAVPPTVAVPANATHAHVFAGLYTLDDFGGVHPVDSAGLPLSFYFPGWSIARSIAQLPGGAAGGYVLDDWGGVHRYGSAAPATISSYWQGWNIARGVQVLPDGSGGYVLDGFGGLHPFAAGSNPMPPGVTVSGYWNGWDVARAFVILPTGTGGYVMDAYGGLHPFAIGANPMPPAAQGAPYWRGWAIARGLALIPGTTSGYVLDGWGGLHPFNGAPSATVTGYWQGWDIARGVYVAIGSNGPEGYTLDGFGGVHPFNGMPAAGSFSYWPGQELALGLSGS